MNREAENTAIKQKYLLVDVPAPRQSDTDNELKTKSVIVSQINVPEEEIADFADSVKTVVGIHDKSTKED